MPLNKSCSRTIDILELLSKSVEPLTLGQICKDLSMPKSSTFEIMNTLLEKEVVVYADERLKSYQLGIKMFRIGSRALSKTSLYNTAQPVLMKLSKSLKETVYLAVENQGKIIYLDKVESAQPIKATCEIGSSNYMHVTGLGKALLATYSDEKVRSIIGTGNLRTFTPQSIADAGRLSEELKATKVRGYAIDDRESMEFVKCVAAPIRDHSGDGVAAISIAVLYNCMTDEYSKELGGLVVDAALNISRQLGYAGKKLY